MISFPLTNYSPDVTNEEIAYNDADISESRRTGCDPYYYEPCDEIYEAHHEFRRLFIELHGSPELKEQTQKVDELFEVFSHLRNDVVASREMTESIHDELKGNENVLSAHRLYHDASYRLYELIVQARERSTTANAMRPN